MRRVDSSVGNLRFGHRWSGASPLLEYKCASAKANSVCAWRPSHAPPLIKLLNRTSHLIVTSHHPHRRDLCSSGQRHCTPPQRSLLIANYTGPHHSQGLAKLDSLYFLGLRMNLSNFNFPCLLPYLSQGASCQAEWGDIPSGIISQRHTMQSNFISPHSITVNSVSQGQ